jgi:competence protein ComFC
MLEAGAKTGKAAFRMYQIFWAAVDWIYPPYCGGCQKFGERWCVDCKNQTTLVGSHICSKCGNFINEGELCPRCSASAPSYQALRSWGIFIGPLREAIHRLKYKHDVGLGEALSQHLIDFYQTTGWKVDIISPVPLSNSRQQERGYNQSELLALPLALAYGISYKPKAITRIRNTRSQVGLKAGERLVNVKGAFIAKKEIVEGKIVLLVDDVTTTGATISASAEALMDAGAQVVYGLTLARSNFGMEVDQSQATGSMDDQEPDKTI